MSINNKAKLEKLTWKGVRDEVAQVNPEFTAIVDQLSPSNEDTIYRINYPFGARIFNKGILNIPNEVGELVAINHHSIPQELSEQLSYREIPLGMVLNKVLENHVEYKQRVIPLTVFSAGDFFGVWETLDPPHSLFPKTTWNLTSGARSLFMLAKISEEGGNKRLKEKFNMSVSRAKSYKDHWKVFKDIANSDAFPTSWNSEVILFSKSWFKKIYSKDKAWLDLRDFFYDYAWKVSMFWRHQVTWDLVWQSFVDILINYNTKIDYNQLETLKHLIAVGTGALPLFAPADDSNVDGPIKELQMIFMEDYGLKYAPTIMRPIHFPLSKTGFGYYSVQEPTLIESVPKSRAILNVMQFTRELGDLVSLFKEKVLDETLKVENTLVYTLMEKVQFDFFHSDPDIHGRLKSSHLLTKDDPSLIAIPPGYGDREFCSYGRFVKGCVRLKTFGGMNER